MGGGGEHGSSDPRLTPLAFLCWSAHGTYPTQGAALVLAGMAAIERGQALGTIDGARTHEIWHHSERSRAALDAALLVAVTVVVLVVVLIRVLPPPHGHWHRHGDLWVWMKG
jgi:hypothetical protein